MTKNEIFGQRRESNEDLEESRDAFEKKLNEIESLLKREDKEAVEKIRRASKRRAESLLEENRVKRRKLGAKITVKCPGSW